MRHPSSSRPEQPILRPGRCSCGRCADVPTRRETASGAAPGGAGARRRARRARRTAARPTGAAGERCTAGRAWDAEDASRVTPVKRTWPFLVLGVLLGLVGLIWTLQGLNVLPGSAMSGSPLWATIGPFVLLAGLALIVVGIVISRRRKTP